MRKIISHLKDNGGDAYIENIILFVIAFTIGSLLLVILSKGFQSDGVVTKWISRVMGNALSGEKIV